MSEHKARICICIPARYNSSRLPGKLMYDICGKKVLQLTYEKSLECKYVDDVFIFTDNHIIYDFMETLGANVIMTDENCKNGSERLSKYLDKIPGKYDIIVNVQADEPFIDPRNVDYVIEKHIQDDSDVFYTTLHQKLSNQEYISSSACLTVTVNKTGKVMYYSRSVIPGNKQNDIKSEYEYLGFTGIYVFNRQHLALYKDLEDTPCQLMEDIEQLKILEHGYEIQTYEAPHFNEISLNDIKDYDYLKTRYEH